MGLTHALACRICGERKTKRENQICSQCARLTCAVPCKVCGKTGVRLYDSICASCRSRAKMKPYKDYLDDAIADAEKNLLVLKCLRRGLSYQEAGKLSGLSKSGIVARLKKCLPAEALDFSEVTNDEV